MIIFILYCIHHTLYLIASFYKISYNRFSTLKEKLSALSDLIPESKWLEISFPKKWTFVLFGNTTEF